MEFYTLTEIMELSSGEKSVHVDVYATKELAISDMKSQIEEHVSNNEAFIVEEDELKVTLSDPEENVYQFILEKKRVKEY